jgi:FMN-dependent NADH-azoreductase
MKILHISANPKPRGESISKGLTEVFFNSLKNHDPHAEVTKVDLYESPPPFFTYDAFRYFWMKPFDETYTPSKQEEDAAAYAREQAKLFCQADVVVLTAPMWNFSCPAILKAWQDQVIAPGLTFQMGPDGINPLHKVKSMVLLTSSGGVYGKENNKDSLTTQLKNAFGFIGITDFEIAWASGQNPFFYKDIEERKNKAMDIARELGAKIAGMEG